MAIGLVLGLFAATAGQAQQVDSSAGAESAPLTVGVYVSPPFVMKQDDRFTGMAIDLWEHVTEPLGLDSTYVELDTIADLIEATANGTVDAAVTNLTVTRDRVEVLDFTHPWFDAGLRVMVEENRSSSFWDILAGLQASGHLTAYAWIIGIILVATVLLTLFDRRFDRNFPEPWHDGIAESFYTVMSVATTGKPPSRKNLFGWIGRVWQGLWLVCGVAVLAYVTSSVTSVMTALTLTNQVNSVADLPGRPVAVFSGTVAERYAADAGFDARSFAHIDEAVDALVKGRVLAVVADAPVLEFYTYSNPSVPVAVVGAIFEPDKYAFGLPHGSPLSRPLTVEVIGAAESGGIAEIRERYFGDLP
ncbi:transporter substrate-binding domain-containing protein [Devosia sp. LC5]|uniref:transporter substrate-binding domain-containing protein n=1 Tax=Devosia sp. LC5 TaxID=1502724 RepID=UPI000A9AA456|nr:transporter substrate-binding domain-containing protein [Devosia sp. LC5]